MLLQLTLLPRFSAGTLSSNNRNAAASHGSSQRKAAEYVFLDKPFSIIHHDENTNVHIADDNGYLSNSGTEASSRPAANTASVDTNMQSQAAEPLWNYGYEYADTAASAEPNNGSDYDDDMEDIAEVKERKSRRISSTCKASDLSPAFASLDARVTSPDPLELWMQTSHRHESLAYRLSRPTKKRRSHKY